MYSFDTSLGGGRVADATRQLAKQSERAEALGQDRGADEDLLAHRPDQRQPSKNVFLKTVVPFLRKKIK